jgi:2-keto-4-pentenoate hydratase/2-oxohepta-3-ene-1,7-dioic acid hydratase in catechol pathway
MKLVGIKRDGQTVVARVDGETATPLCTVEEFWTSPHDAIERPADSTPVLLADETQVPLVPASARIICIGLNYKEHAAEGSFAVPDYPTIFGRWTGSLSVDGVAVPVPLDEVGLDWEGEIAAYVGETLSDVDADTARAAIFGYSTFNDLTSRRAQKLTAQWTLGKNGDFSGPMGPLVSADEVGDLRDGLQVQTRVNGAVVQDGNSRDMIFEIGEILALVSRTMTLHPGDVVATGTPEGVGYVRTPPWLLGPGDVVEVEIEKLGILTTPVVGVEGRLHQSAISQAGSKQPLDSRGA